MTRGRCPGCGKPRDVREPCGHCGGEPCAAAPKSGDTTDVVFDEPPTAEVPLPPTPKDALRRFSSMMNESPVFASEPSTDEIEIDPEGRNRPLQVTVEAKFETPSAPAAAEPIVHCLLSVLPEGPPLIDPKEGPVAHVILALDLSASMNHPDKYPVLTDALSSMLYELRSTNSAEVLVSVVVYAYGSQTLLRAVSSKTIEPREVLALVDSSPLRFGRYTDVVGALHRAGTLAKRSLEANKAMPQRIYLLTDGRPQDMDGARDMLARIGCMPVDVDGLAFGVDADVARLQNLVSGARGGTVKQVRPDTLSDAFGRIAEVAQRVVANRCVFDFELASGVVGGEAFRFRPARHRYGDAAFRGGRRFTTDLGTMESGRPYTLLFELRLPRAVAGRETEIGRVTVKLPGFGGPRIFEHHLALLRHDGPARETDPEVLAAREVVQALAGDDPAAMLRALKVRRRIYMQERRDRHVLGVIDKAIAELEEKGTLAALSAAEHATLLSHTCTAGGSRPVARRSLTAKE
jgi:uncharacterized protein YegL